MKGATGKALLVLAMACSGCGFLDEEMFYDELTLEEELWMDGMSLHGTGTSGGCGGGYYARSYSHAYGMFGYGYGWGNVGSVHRPDAAVDGDTGVGPRLVISASLDQEDEFRRDVVPEGIAAVMAETSARREEAVAGFIQMRSSRDAR